MGTEASIIDMGTLCLRVTAVFAFIPVFVNLFFFWSWGSGKMWFVPACIYGPMQAVLSAGIGTLCAFLTVFTFQLVVVYMNVGTPISYVFGGLFILLFTVLGAVISKIKQKKK